MFRSVILVFLLSVIFISCAEKEEPEQKPKAADKPLFRDPIYDGAADPVVIWNKKESKWFMFYTNRRAKADGLDGVTWVHGTKIGIAESTDGGATWKYRDTCSIPAPYTETHWAPEVIEFDGTYHMYLTYVPGVFTDWSHPRDIIHLTSDDLIHWNYKSTLELATKKVIDACVFRMADGNWRMWYNNEKDNKSIYYADSKDLYNWEDKGKAVGDQRGEGPKVFQWKDKYWMVTDVWDGLALYESENLTDWKRIEGNLVQEPGTGNEDNVVGHHPDVVVNNDRAYLFYFTHPGQVDRKPGKSEYEMRRSSIQVVEFEYKDGILVCDRNKPTYIDLVTPVEK